MKAREVIAKAVLPFRQEAADEIERLRAQLRESDSFIKALINPLTTGEIV